MDCKKPDAPKAILAPFDRKKDTCPNLSKKVVFDFNPETLKLRVETGESKKNKKRGSQQSQHVGETKATLSFEITFDNTRPNADKSKKIDDLDIRKKTKPIADFLKAEGKGKNSAAKKLSFIWGTIIFNGIITSFDETLEYFSQEGVPLRSKISITLEENDFKYDIKADQVKANKEIDNKEKDKPKNPDDDLKKEENNEQKRRDDFLSKLADGNLSLDSKLGLELGLELGLDTSFDASLNLGVELSAGLDLSISDSIDVFGESVLNNDLSSSVDLGSTVISKKNTPANTANSIIPDPAKVQSEWAGIDAPQAGSKANNIASLAKQNQQQNSLSQVAPTMRQRNERTSQQTAATMQGKSSASVKAGLSFLGSPPQQPITSMSTELGVFPKRQLFKPESRCDLSNRPQWEKLQASRATNQQIHSCTKILTALEQNRSRKHG